MPPYTGDPILGIRKEHALIVRIRAVGGVRQPEVLPNHHPVAVAAIVELFVADLPYPVPYHVEMHLAVVVKSYVVIPGSEHQVLLGEAPVTTLRDKPAAINIQFQCTVGIVPGHLPYSGFEMYGIGKHSIYLDGESGIVQRSFAISHRPPEVHSAVFQLREVVGRE